MLVIDDLYSSLFGASAVACNLPSFQWRAEQCLCCASGSREQSGVWWVHGLRLVSVGFSSESVARAALRDGIVWSLACLV